MPASAQDSDVARAIEATYLYKLAPFVVWPDGALGEPNSPVTICVSSDPFFTDLVRRAVVGQEVFERALSVIRIATVEQIGICRILYASPGGDVPVEQLLNSARGRPVLTVTEAAQSESAGSVVHFLLHEGRVRFEIDLDAASRQGLAISSRVLELALRVRGERS